MKKIMLSIYIALTSVIGLANDCKDAVQPINDAEMIFNCCINEIKNGNVVHFTKNGESFTVEAVSIIRDGKMDELGISETMIPALNEVNTNFSITIGEVGLNSKNALLKPKQANQNSLLLNRPETTPTFFVFNIMTAFKSGLPIWRSGNESIAENKNVKIENGSAMKLSLGKTVHGAGLNFRF